MIEGLKVAEMKAKADFPVVEVPLELVSIRANEVKGDRGKAIIRKDTMSIISTCSSKYQLVKHIDCLNTIESALNANGVSYKLDHILFSGSEKSSISARYILKEKHITIKKDDSPHYPIINLHNSYDSLSKLHLEIGIWRQVCSNGMFGLAKEMQTYKVHVGKNVDLLVIFNQIDEIINTKLPTVIKRVELLQSMKPKLNTELKEYMGKVLVEEYILYDNSDKYYKELGNNRYAQLQSITEFAQTCDDTKRLNLESTIFNFILN